MIHVGRAVDAIRNVVISQDISPFLRIGDWIEWFDRQFYPDDEDECIKLLTKLLEYEFLLFRFKTITGYNLEEDMERLKLELQVNKKLGIA